METTYCYALLTDRVTPTSPCTAVTHLREEHITQHRRNFYIITRFLDFYGFYLKTCDFHLLLDDHHTSWGWSVSLPLEADNAVGTPEDVVGLQERSRGSHGTFTEAHSEVNAKNFVFWLIVFGFT